MWLEIESDVGNSYKLDEPLNFTWLAAKPVLVLSFYHSKFKFFYVWEKCVLLDLEIVKFMNHYYKPKLGATGHPLIAVKCLRFLSK